MDVVEIIMVILLSIAAYGAMIGSLLMLLLFRRRESVLGRKPLILVALSCGAAAIVWVSLIFYITLPEASVVIFPTMILAGLFLYILSYHFVFEVTRLNDDEKFFGKQYIIPVLGLILVLFEMFFINFDQYKPIVESGSSIFAPTRSSAFIFTSSLIIFLLFNIIYTFKCLLRAKHYRRVVVNYSSDELRGSIRWIYHLVLTRLAMILAIMCCILLSDSYLIICIAVIVLFATLKYALIVHNVMFENFVLIKQNLEDVKSINDTGCVSHELIRKFESYMRREKPYLKPRLKITDITSDLATNRTSLSVLINRTYGMNFCRYINRFRLEELEKLRNNPAYSHLPEVELVLMAGFSDWRGYKRVKERESFTI